MKHKVVIATHHKTGTVWMDGVFRGIAKDLGVSCIDFEEQSDQLEDLLEKPPFILLNTSSKFDGREEFLDRPDVRTLHLIRDPRDVVISAMHYHKRAREDWLHEATCEYGGATYQQCLKGLASKERQYLFEMDHSSAGTINDMLDWRYGRSNCLETRYENLITDLELVRWREVLTFLGFEGDELKVGMRRFWQNSLFGGLTRLGNKHVRCGDAGQWRREFTVPLAQSFLLRFPGALQMLGYEADYNWVTELQPARLPPAPPRLPNEIISHLPSHRGAPHGLANHGLASLLTLILGV